MKKTFLMLTVLLFAGMTSFAQIDSNEYELIKDSFKLGKKDLLAQYMQLTSEQGTAFWPIYNAYENERTTISKTSFELLDQYAKKYDSLTDGDALALTKKSLDTQQKILQLRQKYLGIMVTKKISPRIIAKFLMFEDYIYTNVRSQLSEQIPMIDQLKQ